MLPQRGHLLMPAAHRLLIVLIVHLLRRRRLLRWGVLGPRRVARRWVAQVGCFVGTTEARSEHMVLGYRPPCGRGAPEARERRGRAWHRRVAWFRPMDAQSLPGVVDFGQVGAAILVLGKSCEDASLGRCRSGSAVPRWLSALGRGEAAARRRCMAPQLMVWSRSACCFCAVGPIMPTRFAMP